MQKLDKNPQRIPIDVKIMGVICILSGIIPLVSGLSYLMEPHSQLAFPQYILIGIVTVQSQLWAGIFWIVDAGVSVVIGYGIIRLRAYGWWLLMVDIINSCLNGLRTLEYVTILGSVLIVVSLAWAILRFPLYHPRAKMQK